MNRRETELFLAEKGLAYCASKGYEAEQVSTAPTSMGDGYSVVIARVENEKPHQKETFHWGFYRTDEAVEVAKAIKRLRKVQVNSVTVIHSAERF